MQDASERSAGGAGLRAPRLPEERLSKLTMGGCGRDSTGCVSATLEIEREFCGDTWFSVRVCVGCARDWDRRKMEREKVLENKEKVHGKNACTFA